jgi:hypothetical protein
VEARLNIDRIKAIQAKIARRWCCTAGLASERNICWKASNTVLRKSISARLSDRRMNRIERIRRKACDRSIGTTVELITDELEIEGSAQIINP